MEADTRIKATLHGMDVGLTEDISAFKPVFLDIFHVTTHYHIFLRCTALVKSFICTACGNKLLV
jgi:hypothetical protein